jgi:hypothetical protein
VLPGGLAGVPHAGQRLEPGEHALHLRRRPICTARRGMLRSFSAAAMARNDVAPATCISAIVGAMSAARALARNVSAARPAARALAMTSAVNALLPRKRGL